MPRRPRTLGNWFSFLFLPVLALALTLNTAFAQTIELNTKVRQGSFSETILQMSVSGQLPAQQLRLQGADQFRGFRTARALTTTDKKHQQLARLYTLRYDSADLQPLIAAMMATGDFEWVEENRNRQLHGVTADPPTDPRIDEQWYHSYIRTFEAWDSTKGSSDVLIGVLDTGLDYEHPEFEGQVAVNPAEDINGNGTFEPWPDTTLQGGVSGDFDGIDNDGNGFSDDVIGYDFTDQPRSPFGGDYLFEDANPMDDNNHGTLVAGIIAAKEDNNLGGAGVAPGCRLKVLRAFSANGSGEDDDIARAIIYAADNGIQILNFSFGDIYPSQMMHEAIKYAAARGVVMIASAGNGTGDNIHYPSNFDEVIAVSASALNFDETSEILWPLSSFGLTVSLAAPGSGILTPIVQDTANLTDFDFFSGTSTAAPMVAGAVGLLFSQRGVCTPQQVRGILTSSADDISSPGWDHLTGAGRLNILKALQVNGASDVQLISPINDSGTAGDSVWVVGTALDPQFDGMEIDYMVGTEGTGSWIPIASGLTDQVFRDTLAMWNVSALSEGEYTLRLRVDKTNGSTAEDRIRFVIDRTAPNIDLRVAAPAWDNFERKLMFIFRSEDRGVTRVHYRKLGAMVFQEQVFDRETRNGHFLLGIEALSDGDYEYYLSSTNPAGLVGQTPLDTISFATDFINGFGYDTLTYSLPMGHYLPTIHDFDNDGLDEVIMSEYDERLGFGKLKYYEYNGTFQAADSLTFKPILIPKDVADADGDGLDELLCSVNDSTYIVEQAATDAYPAQIIFSDFTDQQFPARFGDPDGDLDLELITKDFEDYRILEPNGNGGYALAATLQDVSPNYTGSVAPLALVHDFDGDNAPELIYGDFDGDFLVYEHQGGNSYDTVFMDTTTLTKSGSYLAQGDFDDDGQDEFFVAVHTTLNRNEADFEYESPFWYLRIFKAVGNDQYQVVWEDYLFDIDTENFNAVTAGNLDTDTADELLFSTFPRTYLIEHDGAGYGMSWFHYGFIGTHHLFGDFNGNGVNEFALGRGDKALFWEKDFNYQGPQISPWLDGFVIDSASVALEWQAAPNATDYRLWRGEVNGGGSILISLVDSTSQLSYIDAGLTPDQAYLYVVESKNTALTPVYSDFSFAVVLTPHGRGQVDSVVAINATQVTVHFSRPVRAIPEDKAKFRLDNSATPNAILSSGDRNDQVLLSFNEEFSAGTHQLVIDSTFRDLLRGPFAANSLVQNFTYIPDTALRAWFTRWEIVDESTAQIWFNVPMDSDVLELSRWRVLPFGSVGDVAFGAGDQQSVVLSIEGAALGALGYPLSVILDGGTALNGAKMMEKEGNIATFSAFKPDLTEAYVYPNPYRRHEMFDGVRFANLTRDATVHIYSAAGRKVITVREADGDGAVDWNLMTEWGDRIKPGVYLFRIEAPDVDEVVGRFTILE